MRVKRWATISATVRSPLSVKKKDRNNAKKNAGDVNRTHFIQPKDAGTMAQVGEAILDNIKRPVDFIHMPVPKERTDKAYFEPLRGLLAKADSRTEFVLGVVKEDDMDGTVERIRAASEVVGPFGVATEYGIGRRTREMLQRTLDIYVAVSDTF